MTRDYRHAAITPENESEKLIAIIKRLLKFNSGPKVDVTGLFEETIRIISSQLEINEVSVLMLDPKDNKYRYIVFYGLRKDVIKTHKEIEYTYDEIIDYEKKKMKKISDLTHICFAENRTEDEFKFFNLHIMKNRAADDDYIEGDFLDCHFYDSKGQLLGYIEYTGTKKNKMPSARAILIIELMSMIIGTLLSERSAK